MDPQELLFAWRVGYDALDRGEANHFQCPQLREAWEQGNLAARDRRHVEATRCKTLIEVAEEMGMSRARVWQIERRAIRKMRSYVRRLAG